MSQRPEKKNMDKFWETLGENFIFVVVMLVPICIVAITSYFGHKRTEMVHRERMAAIEKGLVPPGELRDPQKEERSDEAAKPAPNYLRRGLFWLCPGAGAVAYCILFLGDVPMGVRLPVLGVSVVCAGIGAAYLAIFLIEGEKARGGVIQ
jgi:hypothetical protein